MNRPPSGEHAARLCVAGVVPAAGASARMGRPKALLDAGGRSFVAAVVGALVGGGCDPVVVVIGAGQPEVRRRAEGAGALVLENPDPGEGPITSLRLALVALGTSADGMAVLPVDHPAVRAKTVAALVAALGAVGGPLVLPTFGGHRGHPAVFHRRLFPELLDPALEGGARTVVHRHLQEAGLVEVDDPGVLADIDTPDAYRAVYGAWKEP
ncbi:MAG TPA: nucleotidyltransferase family protein [Longimicrobiales bacterium]|nr:nucleotidyltransferase family protein [Longimicrobiales bacterium]